MRTLTESLLSKINESELIKTNIDNLELSIYNAIKGARARNVEDNGSCNFDEVVVEINATRTEIMSMEYKCEKIGSHLYTVDVDLDGQANKRTAMAETIVKSLKNAGYNAYVKYVLD